jgi:hypothetical protein
MEGHFNLTLMDAGGIPDAVWKAARREGRVRELLRGRKVKARARTKNLVFDNFAGYTFVQLFSGPAVTNPYGNGGTAAAYFALVTLDNRDADPTYEETVVAYQVDSYSYKRFIEDDADTPDIVADPSGRERVIFRSRFLWTPVESVASNIRGIATWHGSDADNTGNYFDRGSASRVRLYDSKGRKITINKTILDILLVEYEFTLTGI